MVSELYLFAIKYLVIKNMMNGISNIKKLVLLYKEEKKKLRK
jgi:hypothetical protein